jgi:hypothetical protein
MNYQQLEEELEKDTQIDITALADESIRCSRLHAKWLRYWNEFRIKYHEQSKVMDAMEGIRRRYFDGELSRTELAEYGWEPWNLAKAKTNSERDRQIETDPVMIKLRDKLFRFKLCADTCEEAIKEIKQRSHNIKSAIEWRKFEAGN